MYRWKGHLPFGSYYHRRMNPNNNQNWTFARYSDEKWCIFLNFGGTCPAPTCGPPAHLRRPALTSTIMSNSWADESEMGDDDGVGIGGREVQQQPQQRPRLQLKPRSQNPEHTSTSTTTSKSNPFGAAKPREEGELIYGRSQVILVLDQHIYQLSHLRLSVYLSLSNDLSLVRTLPQSYSLFLQYSTCLQGY